MLSGLLYFGREGSGHPTTDPDLLQPRPFPHFINPVFVIEYLGPILIMLAYATRPALLYGGKAAAAAWTEEARLGVACWVAHFVKRELETFFVHKFSRPTM